MTKSTFLLAVSGAACLVSACTKVEGIEPRPPRPVRVQAVTVSAPASGVRYSATIEAFQEVPLAFKASGYVNELVRRQGADGRLIIGQADEGVTGRSYLLQHGMVRPSLVLDLAQRRLKHVELGLMVVAQRNTAAERAGQPPGRSKDRQPRHYRAQEEYQRNHTTLRTLRHAQDIMPGRRQETGEADGGADRNQP